VLVVVENLHEVAMAEGVDERVFLLEAFAQLRIVADRPGSDFDGDDLIGWKDGVP